MNDERIIVFGQFLTTMVIKSQLEVNSLCLNDKTPIDAIRRKAGHLEAYQFALGNLKELLISDIDKFRKQHLEEDVEEDDSKENEEE